MRRGLALLVAIAALVIGAALVAPSTSEAVVITSVTVTVGSTTFCDTTGACPVANRIWNLGGGVNINPGQSLILTQNAGTPPGSTYNFDTSEGNLPSCSAATPCATTITINGIVIGPGNNILANNNLDPGGNNHNEASDYGLYGSTAAFDVFTGYADNIHLNACADANGNCHPDPFAASANDVFIGNGAIAPFPGFASQPNPNHCTTNPPGAPDCFDAGVVRIIASQVRVPEPSSLLLLGVGIISLAAWGRSRRA